MELIKMVTNEELSPNYFINHLKSKINDFCWNITFKEVGWVSGCKINKNYFLMANLNQPPSRVTPNLLHILNAFTDSSNTVINTIVELNSNTINKYELITETGHLKLIG